MGAEIKQMPQRRMSLAAVTRGRQEEPITLLLYGGEGVGKSTFGADAPKPIFIDGEQSTEELDVARFPTPETWQDVLDAITVLGQEDHDYETLVIDTLDWIEPLVWAHVVEQARDAKIKSIEDFGFGKGYVAALDEWRRLLAYLERLRAKRRINIILIAHSQVKTFKNPEGDDFDRYELKLHAKASGLMREWVKAVLFAKYETFAHRDDKTKRVRGVSTGARLMHTVRTAAYDAKTRYAIPEEMPLSWDEFFAAVRGGVTAPPDVLIAEITAKAKQAGGKLETDTMASLERCGTDARKLAQLNDWINGKVGDNA